MKRSIVVKHWFFNCIVIMFIGCDSSDNVEQDLTDSDGDGIANAYDVCKNEVGIAEFQVCPATRYVNQTVEITPNSDVSFDSFLAKIVHAGSSASYKLKIEEGIMPAFKDVTLVTASPTNSDLNILSLLLSPSGHIIDPELMERKVEMD